MGTIASRHAREITHNVEQVLAIEMLASAQGMDFWDMEPGKGTKIAHDFIRKHISFMDEDRILYKDMEVAKQLVTSGEIVKAVEEYIAFK